MREVVARGHLKVDAQRALHKLRDHMLVDVNLYATEIARAATALGATRLDVTHDADDVVLAFDVATPLDPEVIASARDHVLAGAADGSNAPRLLGIGLVAALASRPAFVDVTIADAHGACVVRFEPSYIEKEEAAPRPRPDSALADGRSWMRVHVRRRLGLARRLLRETAPEIPLLLASSADSPLAISVNGAPAERRPPPVLRVGLDLPEATRAVLEVYSPEALARAEHVYLEHGLCLVHAPTISALSLDPEGLPLRVIVDAPRLPTNASRSELREQDPLVARVKARIAPALDVAIAVLTGERSPDEGGANLGHTVEVLEESEAPRTRALSAIAAAVAECVRRGALVSPAARALLARPFLRDAVGDPLTLDDALVLLQRPPVVVHRAPAPEPRILEPWLAGVPWLTGEPAERVFTLETTTPADALVAEARRGGERRARALAHPPSRPVLPRSPALVSVTAFRCEGGPFAGLEGEVAITKAGADGRRPPMALLFVDERLLEAAPLPGATLPVAMALAWPGRFRPRRTYDAVERDEDLERAIVYAMRVAASAVASYDEADPELVRQATEAWLLATDRLRDVRRHTLGALGQLKAWPTSEPGRLASFAQIAAYAQRTGALCFAPAGAGRAVDGRPVLDARVVRDAARLLASPAALVDYAAALAVPASAPLTWLARACEEMVEKVSFSRDHVSGFVGVEPGRLPSARVFHRGTLVHQTPHVGASIVVEDARVVPGPAPVRPPPLPDLEHEEAALLELVLDRCERGEIEPAQIARYLDDARETVRAPGPRGRLLDLADTIARRKASFRRTAYLALPETAPPRVEGPRARVDGHVAGAATVFLPPASASEGWTPPPIVVRFANRTLAELAPHLPVAAVVELAREEHVGHDWASLREAGLAAARQLVEAAAIELVEEGARAPRFADDLAKLHLATSLLDEPRRRARLEPALRAVAWPTVDGGSVDVGTSTRVPAGAHIYTTWLGPEDGATPLDAPSVWIPDTWLGALRRRVFAALGCELAFVTDDLARLQAQRARNRHDPPPRLAGRPLDPRLRATLASFGVTVAEGEVELAEPNAIMRVGRDGGAYVIDVPTALPIRATYRCDDRDVDAAFDAVVACAESLTRALAPELETLPEIVRRAVRALVCTTAARGESLEGLTAHAVFEDTTGAVRASIDELLAAAPVRVVTDPPPYPAEDETTYVLSATERDALADVVRFEDVTAELRELAEGARRRAAPPREAVTLDEAQRAACLATWTVDDDELVGEVGVLLPSHGWRRGIEVLHDRRPVVQLADDDGWPIVAVVDARAVTPSRAFTSIPSADATRIRKRLRAIVGRRLASALEAPPTSLGTVRLPFSFAAGRPRVSCLGVFWLDPEWPERPEVHVMARGHDDPFFVPRRERSAAALSDVVPVRGRLWVHAPPAQLEAVCARVFTHVASRLERMVAAAARAVPPRAPREVTDAYAWDLRLLGVGDDVDVEAALAADRIDETLLRVVARRAPHRIATEPPAAETVAEAPPSVPPEPMWRGIVRSIFELVRGPEVVSDHPIGKTLADALARFELTGAPVAEVVATRSGRPVRYDRAAKRVLVNVGHASVRALAKTPEGVTHLAAAAVSEVNRALDAVTDAEERSVLLEILR